MTGPLTAQSDAPLTPVLGERWLGRGRTRRVGFCLALAAALAAHLFLGVLLTGGLDVLLGGVLGSGREARRPIGDQAGQLDGVAAEVIDAVEFNKRYIAFKAGRAEADSEAQPQKPAERAEPQPKPTEEPVAALKPADGWEAAQPTQESRQEKPAQEPILTDAEMRELVTQSVEDLQSALVSESAPGAARLGEASPFVRSVIRTLKNTMPRPAGMKGRVLIQLIVGATGEIEALRVVRSSGRPELDRFVAERVARTKLAVPPATASLRERMFQISYEYN
jgi:TonB family protein